MSGSVNTTGQTSNQATNQLQSGTQNQTGTQNRTFYADAIRGIRYWRHSGKSECNQSELERNSVCRDFAT